MLSMVPQWPLDQWVPRAQEPQTWRVVRDRQLSDHVMVVLWNSMFTLDMQRQRNEPYLVHEVAQQIS